MLVFFTLHKVPASWRARCLSSSRGHLRASAALSATRPACIPTTVNPADYGVLDAAAALRRRELSSRELVDACLARIRERDGTHSHDGDPASVNAWVRVYEEDARAAAARADVPERDCDAWARLAAAGMVLLGHLHTHELAAGGTTDQVGNPWALERSAGGSSGGPAAAPPPGAGPPPAGPDNPR